MNRNFAEQPRTLDETLKLILAYTHSGRNLAQRKYVGDHGHPCALACAFTPAQRADIKERGKNEVPIESLVADIGLDNLKAMTGMTLQQARIIQQLNDDKGQAALLDEIVRILAFNEVTINGVRFKIR